MNGSERSSLGAPSPRGVTTTASLLVGLDDLPDGVLVLDADGRVQAVNRAFLDLTGLQAAEVLGQPVEELVAAEDMLRLVGSRAMFAERPSQDNHVIFLAAGASQRSLVVSSAPARDGRHVVLTARAVGSVHEELADLSRWAAREQERSLELSRARDELASKHAALLAAQAELERAYSELRNAAASRQRLENELQLAQRLEAIGQLAAGVAHEINTPMQYIGDNVHFLASAYRNLTKYLTDVERMLLSGGSDVPCSEVRAQLGASYERLRLGYVMQEVPKALEASKDGIEHVSRIVQAMKSFAHLDQDEMVASDLNRALSDTLTVAQNEYKNVAVVQTDLGDLPMVKCFSGKLNQVFLNLIVNAAHAIQDAQKDGLGLISVRTRAHDGWVEIAISDDGCGIPEAIRHQIFDQFFTTKEVGRGTGQGLSLARSIVVDAHGGKLSFESKIGVGSTFLVCLPVEAIAPGQATA